ncbi:MAG: hypothetical protein ACYC5Q_02495 [Thermoleophilia bacterium]
MKDAAREAARELEINGWSAQDAGGRENLRAIAAIDAEVAWGVGDNGIILATTDGGSS